MHPRTLETLTNFDAHRATLKSAFEAVPSERRNQPPGPGRWSPAAVVEHLAMVEERMAGILSSRIAEARAAGIQEETSTEPVLPTFDVSRFIDRTTKVQAPEFALPTGLDATEAWSQLEKATAALHSMVLSGDGLALATIIQPHSRIGPMSVYQWIAFLGAHEARHAEQIREMSGQI